MGKIQLRSYVDRPIHTKLKKKLFNKGMTISGWIRQKVKEELQDK